MSKKIRLKGEEAEEDGEEEEEEEEDDDQEAVGEEEDEDEEMEETFQLRQCGSHKSVSILYSVYCVLRITYEELDFDDSTHGRYVFSSVRRWCVGA